MLRLLVAGALLGFAAAAHTEKEYRDAFTGFVSKYQKTYAHSLFRIKYETFKTNMDFVESHDADAAGFTVELNEFADMTAEEFGAMYKGFNARANNAPLNSANRGEHTDTATVGLPTTVDWRKKGVVTPIKNQGQCGSCWSFSSTGSMEGAHALKTGNLVSLSEQNLMDCSTSYGNMGCNGGLMDQAFEYVIANKGDDTESSYPYTAQDGTCHFKASDVGATISSYQDVSSGDESALQTAVANVGPVSVAIDASHSSFQFYSGGVYNEPACSSTQLDHGVLAVGYGTDSGSDYWLVKNSWGTSWGLSGYIMMSRNANNQCGIATSASYPIV